MMVEIDKRGSLAPHPDDFVSIALMPYEDAVISLESPDQFAQRLAGMPTWAQHLVAVRCVDGEIHSGGFFGLFCSDYGVLTPEAVEGFNAIGMSETASIVAGAMSSFGSPYPRETEKRQQAAESLTANDEEAGVDFWDDYDRRYWVKAEIEAGGFDAAVAAYVREHRR